MSVLRKLTNPEPKNLLIFMLFGWALVVEITRITVFGFDMGMVDVWRGNNQFSWDWFGLDLAGSMLMGIGFWLLYMQMYKQRV